MVNYEIYFLPLVDVLYIMTNLEVICALYICFHCTVFKENVEEQQKSQVTSQSDHPDYLGAIFDYESRAQGVHLLL